MGGQREMTGRMTPMSTSRYDLRFDPNDVGPDLVVECWISQGPRAGDEGYDPHPGESVTIGDDEGPPLRARVTRREGNRIWVQVQLPSLSDAVA